MPRLNKAFGCEWGATGRDETCVRGVVLVKVGRRAIGMSDILRLEEQLAHLIRVVDDLSDVVARRDAEIDLLNRRVELLMRRAVEAEYDPASSVILGDEKPPHW